MPAGYLVGEGPAGRVEFDTLNCGHCQRILVRSAGPGPDQLGGFCRGCMRHLCRASACHGGCKPFERKLEAAERRERLRRAVLG